MTALYGAIHYKSKTDPLQPLVAEEVTLSWMQGVIRPRIAEEIRRPSDSSMVFPVAVAVVQPFSQVVKPVIEVRPHHQEQPHFDSVSIFPPTPKIGWMVQNDRVMPPTTYLHRPMVPFLIVAVLAAVQIAWLVDHGHHIEAEQVIRQELPFLPMPVVSDRIAWLRDFSRIVREQHLDPNLQVGDMVPIWVEDDDARYRGLVRYTR